MDTNRRFWESLLHAHGHTGWADPVIYAYDQLERLKIIRAELATIKAGPTPTALDFGCGTGDFSRLLLKMGFTVCGYDPFVRPSIRSPGFRYASACDEIGFDDVKADIALSITVLTHILSKDDLSQALSVVRRCLKPGSQLLMIECAPELETEREALSKSSNNDYLAIRTLAEWRDALTRASFELTSARPIPHPTRSPSVGYLAYSRSSEIKLILKTRTLPLVSRLQDPLLRYFANRALNAQYVSAPTEGDSILKLLTCTPL